MSEHIAIIQWQRNQAAFTDNKYSREHLWEFDGGAKILASSSPQVVPVPHSNPNYIDPEEAFIASIASCHMLWFLAIAANQEFTIESYLDRAVGLIGQNEDGKLAITKITLSPTIVFSADNLPITKQVDEMHQEAHHNCFLANSVKTEIIIPNSELTVIK